MPLQNMQKIMQKAHAEGYAVGNFDVFNIELLRGVLRAAQQENAPIIIAYGEVFEPVFPLNEFAYMVKKLAEDMPQPVVLHLDHADNMAFVERAVKHGFTSVMMDASHIDFEGNLEVTRRVMELCAPKGISVEAELGHVGGAAGQYQAAEDDGDECYTEVAEAVRFVEQSGIDLLAVAIGTVHGPFRREPKLNYQRLAEVKAAVDIPLVLHGGSGLPEGDIRRCVEGGINKLNIHTDLVIAAGEAMRKDLGQNIPMLEMSGHVIEAACEVARRKMQVIGCIGKA